MRQYRFEDYLEVIGKIGEKLTAEINTGLSDNKWGLTTSEWKFACVDIRWTLDGNTSVSKLRIGLPGGAIFAHLSFSIDVDSLFEEAYQMKDKVFPDKWYGLVMTLHPDGKCQLDYNYDPNCSDDPSFFDTVDPGST